MERIVHSLLLHLLAQQTDALYHDDRIAGLDADNNIWEVFALADTQKLHAALYDARRGIAVTTHDTVRKRTVVHTDADGCAVLTADTQEAAEAVVQTLQLLLVLLVGIFQMLELTGRINVVAWVDAHLLDNRSSHICHIGIEVYIGTQGRISVAASHQSSLYVAKVLSLARSLGSESNQVGSGIYDADALFYAAFRVHCAAGGHTLDGHLVLTAYSQLTYLNLVCLSSHLISLI